MLNINFEGTNGMMEVSADAQMFIVPNRALKMTNNLWPSTIEALTKECELNGIKITDTEKFVQVWIVSKEDLHTDNLGDHGFHVAYDLSGKEISCGAGWRGVIPASALRDKNEGDTFCWKIPYTDVTIRDATSDTILSRGDEMILTLNITLDQRDYRYRGFGNFEDVLRKVCM